MISNDESRRIRQLLSELIEERRESDGELYFLDVLSSRLNGDSESGVQESDGRRQVLDALGLLSTLALDADQVSLQRILTELSALSGTQLQNVQLEFPRVFGEIDLRQALSDRDEVKQALFVEIRGLADSPINEFEFGPGPH